MGRTLKFTVQTEGDTMTQTGVGNPSSEVWHRLRCTRSVGSPHYLALPAVATLLQFPFLSAVRLCRLLFLTLCAFLAPLAARAQTTATLTVNATTLDPAGGQLTFTFASTFAGTTGFGLTVDFPSAWSYVSGTGEPSIKPTNGQTGSFDWATLNQVTNAVSFSFIVAYPARATSAGITSSFIFRPAAGSAQVVIPPRVVLHGLHAADVDGDSRLSLTELTRVIALYNHRVGTVRTGHYRSASDTEDGYAPGSGGLRWFHSADTNRDGRIHLAELSRLIELFNTRDAAGRSGRYRARADSEDGFAPDAGSSSTPGGDA